MRESNRVLSRAAEQVRLWFRVPGVFVVLALSLVLAQQAAAMPISRTITIDGTMSDWTSPTDITTNPGQFSTDGDGSVCPSIDLDADPDGAGALPCNVLTPGGRDLAKFAYTWDSNSLFFYVERSAGTNNVTDWFFYMDLGNDGFMGPGDRVLRISWSGNTGNTTRQIWDYTPVTGGLGDPVTGDGSTMPGSISNSTSLASAAGGSADGLAMESWIDFADIGLAGPQSIQFHISSGNSTSLPGGIIDNMSGPVGSGLQFAELMTGKTASASSVYGTTAFDYTVTVTNAGDADATNVAITDLLPAGVTYQSHAASQGTYNPATGLWTIGTIPYTTPVNSSATLVITVRPVAVTVATDVTNTTSALTHDQADTDSSNDTGSVTVTVNPGPSITIAKSVITYSDPLNLTTNPKAIPGAAMLYSIDVTNTGTGVTDSDSTVVSDAIPANTELYVGDLGGGPVVFIDAGSGLTYSFLALGNAADSLEFSSNGGSTWNYTPSPDADGYDANVTNIRVTPAGSLAASDGITNPGFTLRFQVRVK